MHIVSRVTRRPASGPGALPHYAATCSCGLTLASSLSARAAEREVEAHLLWALRQVKAELDANRAAQAALLARSAR